MSFLKLAECSNFKSTIDPKTTAERLENDKCKESMKYGKYWSSWSFWSQDIIFTYTCVHNGACHLLCFFLLLALKVLIESSEAAGDFVIYKAKVKSVLKKGKSLLNMIC